LPLSHKSRRKAFCYGYNTQISVDEKSQIILGQIIHDSATEYQALPKLIDNLEEKGNLPEEVLADLGYKSLENFNYLNEKGIKATIARKSDEYCEEEKLEGVEAIWYDEESDEYVCPAGKVFKYHRKKERKKKVELLLDQNKCEACYLKNDCPLLGKKTVGSPSKKLLERYKEYIERTRTDEFIESYRKRKHIVEPVFGNIKNKGMKINRKGKNKVEVWFSLACSAHNFEKLVNKQIFNHFKMLSQYFFIEFSPKNKNLELYLKILN